MQESLGWVRLDPESPVTGGIDKVAAGVDAPEQNRTSRVIGDQPPVWIAIGIDFAGDECLKRANLVSVHAVEFADFVKPSAPDFHQRVRMVHVAETNLLIPLAPEHFESR